MNTSDVKYTINEYGGGPGLVKGFAEIIRRDGLDGLELFKGVFVNKDAVFLIARMFGASGVYCFGIPSAIMYVGQSKNLGERVLSSFKDRLFKAEWGAVARTREIYLGISKTKSEIDARILEVYLINRLDPYFNKDCKNGGTCSYPAPEYEIETVLFSYPVGAK